MKKSRIEVNNLLKAFYEGIGVVDGKLLHDLWIRLDANTKERIEKVINSWPQRIIIDLPDDLTEEEIHDLTSHLMR